MKKIITLVFCLSVLITKAQSPSEQNSPWIESDQNSFVIQLSSNADNVEGALKARLKKEGLKVSSKKGFITCLATNWAKIGTSTMDFYFKIKKVDNGNSVLYVFVSKGYNNFISSQLFPDESNRTKDFLVDMINETKRYELNLAIVGLNKKLKNANDDLDDLMKKQKKMEDEIKELNRKLEDNHTNQTNQAKQIDDFKNQLTDLQNRLDALH